MICKYINSAVILMLKNGNYSSVLRSYGKRMQLFKCINVQCIKMIVLLTSTNDGEVEVT